MREKFSRLFSLLLAIATASPVLAGDSTTQVPEGSALTLFALGVLGVIVGRRFATRPRDRNRDADQHNGEN